MAIGGPSWQDIYDVGLAALQSRRPSLIVRPGDVTDAFLCGGATMANVVIGAAANGFRSSLVLGAQGDQLTIVCHDRGVDRDTGDYAVGTITLTRVSAAAGGGTWLAGSRVATTPDPITGQFATFITNNDLTFSPTALTGSVNVTCTALGNIGNVELDTIDRILDVPAFDSTFTVNNAANTAGGNEAESDDDLQAQTMSYPLTLRRGTIDALLYAATQLTPGVKRASVTRDAGTGIVTVYVCDQFGNSNAALAAAASAVIQGPPAWRGAGDIVNVVAGSLFSQNIVLSLSVYAGVDVTALLAQVSAAVTARLTRLNPGDTLYPTMISTAAENVNAQAIVSCTVVSPSVAIVPTASQAIRAGIITFQ